MIFLGWLLVQAELRWCNFRKNEQKTKKMKKTQKAKEANSFRKTKYFLFVKCGLRRVVRWENIPSQTVEGGTITVCTVVL